MGGLGLLGRLPWAPAPWRPAVSTHGLPPWRPSGHAADGRFQTCSRGRHVGAWLAVWGLVDCPSHPGRRLTPDVLLLGRKAGGREVGQAPRPPHSTRGRVAGGLRVPGPLCPHLCFQRAFLCSRVRVGRRPARAGRASCLSVPACKAGAADAAVGRSVCPVRSACRLVNRCWRRRPLSVVPLEAMALGTVLTLLGAGRPWRSRQGRAGNRRSGKLLVASGLLLPSGGSPLIGVCGPRAGHRAGRCAWPGDGTELAVRGQVSSPRPDLTASPQTWLPPSTGAPGGARI